MMYGQAGLPPTSWINLYERGGSVSTRIALDCEPVLDVAMRRYLDSGCTRDELLLLDMACGAQLRILVSQVGSWIVTTGESRAADDAIDGMLRADAPEWR